MPPLVLASVAGAAVSGVGAIVSGNAKIAAAREAANLQSQGADMGINTQNDAFSKILQSLSSGKDEATGVIRAGRDKALGVTDQTLNDVTGTLNQNKDIYNQSKGESLGFLDDSLKTASGYFNPYQQAGQDALSAYMRGITPGSNFNLDNPVFQYKQDLLKKQTAQALAAAGKGRSDVGINNYLQPALMNLTGQETNDYFSRLLAPINTGYNATSTLAGLTANTGVNKSNISQNTAGNIAGINNAIANVQGAASAARSNIYDRSFTNEANLADAYGRNRANATQENANNISNLQIGQRQAAANGAINAGNAQAGTFQSITDAITGGIGDYAKLDILNKLLGKGAPGMGTVFNPGYA